MSQSLDQIYLHIVYSTKHRQPFLQDLAVRQEVFAYLVGICTNLKCPSIQIGGWHDHVHVLCKLSRNIYVSDLVRELKRSSSIWIKERFPQLPDFYWQAGYGVFSACPSILDSLVYYIQHQDQHHAALTYQEEYRDLCKKYHLEIDERYCWD
jgi:putative transposase